MKNKGQEVKKPVFKSTGDEQAQVKKEGETVEKDGFKFEQAPTNDKAQSKELESKNKEIAELKAKVEEFNNNFKKEVEARSAKAQEILDQKIKEITEKSAEEIKLAKKFAIKDNAEELINIICQMKSVITSSENNPNEAVRNYVIGFKMYMNMFDNLLANMGIKEIVVKPGDVFDEKIMEAVDTEKGSTKAGHIVRIVKPGYFLHDRVLLHVQVVVGK